ncbi:MAG: hypothetical protein U0136_00830 [Bdellovibrionota bacterium]
MAEFELMFHRLCPLNWGWVKVTFFVLALLALAGVLLRRKTMAHVSLELAAFLGLCMIFAHGVVTRGVLGTSVSHHHEWYYYAVLIPHVLSGVVYGYSAIMLAIIGRKILLARQQSDMKLHRRLGYFSLSSLWVSVALSLPL